MYISAVHPQWYGKRFFDFMYKAIKYNDGSTEQTKTENTEV